MRKWTDDLGWCVFVVVHVRRKREEWEFAWLCKDEVVSRVYLACYVEHGLGLEVGR